MNQAGWRDRMIHNIGVSGNSLLLDNPGRQKVGRVDASCRVKLCDVPNVLSKSDGRLLPSGAQHCAGIL